MEEYTNEAAPVHDWIGLLARCAQWGRDNAEWQRSKGLEIPPDRLPATAAPATEAQIAREEARLGVRLPPSLRSFYLQSNGHGVVGNFIWAVRSVEQIGWLRDAAPELYEAVFEEDAALARSLVVSGEADVSWWLLDPGEVDSHGEWSAGRWSSWHPGMRWVAGGFFGLFEDDVSSSERMLTRDKTPRPVPGTGRSRNAWTVGDIDGAWVDGTDVARDGYTYVPAEGFASIVTVSAPTTARVGEWVLLTATRRSGPWNLVRQEEVGPDEIGMFNPPIFEGEVADNLAWSIEPPDSATFNIHGVAGAHPSSRSVKFGAAGTYSLQASSSFPLGVLSNTVTITVE